MTEVQEQRILAMVKEAEEWYDQNNILEYEDDPYGEAMYDGFLFITDMIKIKKGLK